MARGPKVVCIDDQVHNLRVRKMLLEQFGCEVIAVTDAHAGLTEISANPPDVVLLDYNLGTDVTGEDVARDIRVMLPSVPIIMLTGDVNLPESARAVVNAVLQKGSTSPADLLDTIRELVPHTFIKPAQPTGRPQDLAS